MEVKGQAAVTDALYFLLIVTFLSIFLFGFSNTYGNSVRQQIVDETNTNFATSALKTILYSSTPRNHADELSDSSAEIDYLLAILKEDYADDQYLNDDVRKVLGKTIDKILSPVGDSLDYVFYIAIPNEKKYVFMYFHLTNFEKTRSVNTPIRGFYIYKSDPDKPHVNYFCALRTNAGEKSEDAVIYGDISGPLKRLDRLFSNVGPTSQATASIQLIEELSKGDQQRKKAEANLILWDAAWLGVTSEDGGDDGERAAGLLYDYAPDEFAGNVAPQGNWHCVEAIYE